MANKFKTGIVADVEIKLTIEGEVLSALPQIVAIFYYIANGNKHVKFSYHAKDPNEPEISDEAIEEGKTLNTLVVNGDVLEMTIPIDETDTLKIETCDEWPVYVEIAYIDSNGNKQKVVDENECDTLVGTIVKSVTEGWL